MSKIKINEDLCIVCGTCEAMCPDVFKIENGKAKVYSENCKDCEDCKLDEIVSSCPVNAITVEE